MVNYQIFMINIYPFCALFFNYLVIKNAKFVASGNDYFLTVNCPILTDEFAHSANKSGTKNL